MTVIVTMAGKGERFRKAGFTVPKYKIEVRGKTLFTWSMTSLADFYQECQFVFICRKADGAEPFIAAECAKLGILYHTLIELDKETDGQATTALLGIKKIQGNEPILIYNIDTYVEKGELRRIDMTGDGFIPCFEANGDHWSFVRLDNSGQAIEVREKERISNNCSIGAYYFKTAQLFRDCYKTYYNDKTKDKKTEKYIAPIYNQMIKDKMQVRINLLNKDRVHILGTPKELESFAQEQQICQGNCTQENDSIPSPQEKPPVTQKKSNSTLDIVEKSGLLKFCRNHSRIFLYGAGDFGVFYAGILASRNIKVTGFIVSKDKPSDIYCGLPVYTLDEIVDDLTARDGVVLAALTLWQGEMCSLLPNRIPVFGISDHESFKLQQVYYEEFLYNGLKDLFVKTNCLGKLRAGGDIWDNVFRVFASLCNETKEDPELFFVNQPVRLKRSPSEVMSCSFPVQEIAIVLQGPICKENNFTIRTAQFYRELYPNIPIIISTWKGEADALFAKECQSYKIVLLENDLPKNPGFGHVNYQMRSSFYGIQYVANHTKAKYVLKSRTDQRVNRNDFLLHFKNLLALYPPVGSKLQARICFLDMALTLYGPFHLPDYLSFGTVVDMKKLFDDRLSDDEGAYIESHWRRFSQICAPVSHIRKSFAEKRYDGLKDFLYHDERVKRYSRWYYKFWSAEIYIVRSFFEKYIEPIEPEQLAAQYVDFVKDYLICPYNVQVYWQKYDRDQLKCFHDGDYLTWLDFYMNYNHNSD